jgi:2-oxoacid:acceptor oxidoreductase gamma subunit (pyruvate/2-ketoisovalerate family)
MIEIRIHGRGGQGAVVASAVLASALFYDGRYVQAFPAFGVERRGAPVMAFTRWDFKPIRTRTNIYQPDHVIVLDQTLLFEGVGVTAGLKEHGWILVNSPKDLQSSEFSKFKVAVVAAGDIAVRHKLGSPTAPVVNTAILGAFSKITGMVTTGLSFGQSEHALTKGGNCRSQEVYSKEQFFFKFSPFGGLLDKQKINPKIHDILHPLGRC